MVGIWSRFSNIGRSGTHRRAQSAVDQKEVLPSTTDVASVSTVPAIAHGIEVEVEFKPVEHPSEPHDNDLPVQCPAPEHSILNDGRIFRERASSAGTGKQQIAALPVLKDRAPRKDKSLPVRSSRSILPSASAPEQKLLNILEECNTSG